MGRLVLNAARCLRCGDVVESKHRHDFRSCTCGAMFVDGGLSYSRIGFESEADFEDLSVYVDDEELSFDDVRENACAS